MASIRFDRIGKSFGETEIIKNLDFSVNDGEFMVFVGPSGCGKSTVLRMIAGLETISTGELWIGDRVVNDVHPKDRDIAMVFQSYALYPHMSVYDNIAFGLKIRKLPDADIRKRVQDAADLLGLDKLLDRKPKALSGGQRQRVALGRAIVRNPSVFLFDEPLSNLDAELRVQMRAEISKLQRRLNTTTVYVTHDQVEAMTMGQRIAVLSACDKAHPRDTNLMQCGSPMDLYDRPDNIFVARFIGTPNMNIVHARLGDDGATLSSLGGSMPVSAQFKEAAQARRGQEVMLGIRPEHIGAPHEVDWPQIQAVQGQVEMVELLGHEAILHFRVGEQIMVGRLHSHGRLPSPGDTVTMHLKCEAIHLFDPVTELRLR
ncbi:MAG: sn-glycerol-3-phosphate ABC transporter ATP-binding protein UgpC [Gammaproteobacteria bacterium]|nr:sn-glycerol-3-phosphate ABC transporter ATP-binding protein UgpC [Gammaproteobacteria bacterium]MBU1775470.1 sn-glycerol-3-phosphate ABC transporter ATP-binding protein UgpC [Gammaproteobacteria bacterium]MBU1967865.1 sn-glycerol-3-phosphate ABC transporter ATP-binding protein UgpC [Gammaproteobacteria bacterium]